MSADSDQPRERAGTAGGVFGLGTDIVEIERIEEMLDKHDEVFVGRVFTAEETRYCRQHRAAAQHFAGRWAAKEAALKALGTGWAKGIQWTDIEITNLPGGAPDLTLHGAARSLADQRGIRKLVVSISHCQKYAMASVIAVG